MILILLTAIVADGLWRSGQVAYQIMVVAGCLYERAQLLTGTVIFKSQLSQYSCLAEVTCESSAYSYIEYAYVYIGTGMTQGCTPSLPCADVDFPLRL